MNFQKLKERYKNLGAIGRKDLSDNFKKHYDTEIKEFGIETELSLGQALKLYSPEPESNRPSDPVLDLIAYRGLRTHSRDGIAASTSQDFFDTGDDNFALGISYLQNLYTKVVDSGFETEDIYVEYPTPEDFGLTNATVDSANTRSRLPRPFNPQTVGMLETNRDFQPRVRISDVADRRITIQGDKYEAPIVDNPTDTKLRRIGEDDDVPRFTIQMDDATERTGEIGYELAITNKLARSNRLTMESIARIQMTKAMQVENAIVDELLQKIGTGATGFNMSADPTNEQIMKLHATPNDRYQITTLIGTIDAVVKYGVADIFYESSNRLPLTGGRRNFVDSLLGMEFIAKKDAADVAVLGSGVKMIAFDRRNTISYIVEQRGMMNETYREERERAIVMQNTHSYTSRLHDDADNCRWLITMS